MPPLPGAFSREPAVEGDQIFTFASVRRDRPVSCQIVGRNPNGEPIAGGCVDRSPTRVHRSAGATHPQHLSYRVKTAHRGPYNAVPRHRPPPAPTPTGRYHRSIRCIGLAIGRPANHAPTRPSYVQRAPLRNRNPGGARRVRHRQTPNISGGIRRGAPAVPPPWAHRSPTRPRR